MAFETSAERSIALRNQDDAVLKFLKRVNTMVSEADSFIAQLQTAKGDTTLAKTASDAAVLADDQNALLASENAQLAAKITEIDAVIAQAGALKAAVETAVANA